MALLCVEPQADYDRIWPTSADLRVAQSGSASWGTSDVLLMLSAQPFVTRTGLAWTGTWSAPRTRETSIPERAGDDRQHVGAGHPIGDRFSGVYEPQTQRRRGGHERGAAIASNRADQ
jgi:hypothetical protein